MTMTLEQVAEFINDAIEDGIAIGMPVDDDESMVDERVQMIHNLNPINGILNPIPDEAEFLASIGGCDVRVRIERFEFGR